LWRLLYISTRLEATPENLRKCQKIAWDIEEELSQGKFNVETYRNLFKYPKLTLVPTAKPNLLELWSGFCAHKKPSLSPTTYLKEYCRKYTNHIKKLPTLDLTRINEIRNYIEANLSQNLAKKLMTILSACCEWNKEIGKIQHNPFANMASEFKPQKSSKDIHPFSAKEKQPILQAFHQRHPHYYPFVKFLFATGCRTGEAIALRWGNVSNTYITFAESWDSLVGVKDTKTHKTRRFPCNSALQAFLSDLRPSSVSDDDLVFTSPEGRVISNTHFTSRIWKGGTFGGKTYKGIVTALVKAGEVEFYRSPYHCRHTFISMCLEQGVTVSQVAKLVGNSPKMILEHYAGSVLRIDVPVF